MKDTRGKNLEKIEREKTKNYIYKYIYISCAYKICNAFPLKSATRSITRVLPFSVSSTSVHFSLRSHSKLPLNWRAPFGRKTQTNTIGPSTSSL